MFDFNHNYHHEQNFEYFLLLLWRAQAQVSRTQNVSTHCLCHSQENSQKFPTVQPKTFNKLDDKNDAQ